MKNQLLKLRICRENVKTFELTRFILKLISTNENFTFKLRWKSLHKLFQKKKAGSKILITKGCVKTKNKKSFTKISNFSRIVFLKLVRSGNISGLKKGIW